MMSMTWTPAQVRHGWRLPVVALLALLALILWTYHDTATAMVVIWSRSQTFTHAFVVPPIVAWLVWRQRGELAPLQPRPVPWVLLPMAGLALLWWLGSLVQVAAAMQLALVAMLVASVPLVLGWRVARVLAFPLAFLFFCVPIGEFLTPTLMHWTAEMLVAGLRATGIPVYQEGQQLVIPSGRWAVVAACSGIRYLMATFMVGSLFAYLNYTSTRKRLIFVAVSLVLPVVANWVRAYIIVMLGHLSNNEIATGVDHIVYGWVFFGIIILGLFFIGARWADPDGTQAAADQAELASRLRNESQVASWQPVAVACAAVVALAWPHWASRVAPGGDTPVVLRMPQQLGGWQAGALPARAWSPFFSAATQERHVVYAGPSGEVAVHVSYYRGQAGDVKLVSSENRFLEAGNPNWHVVAERVAQVPGGSDRPDTLWHEATLMAQDGSNALGASRQRLTVWRIYWLGGPTEHSNVRAKLRQAWQAVRGEPDDGAAIHLVSSLRDDDAARRQLADFVNTNFPALLATLSQARAGR